ncbi:MAG: phosphoribosylamine--glycine ligase [Candidatus Hydrogenedentota bacterium]|jgi:phosphoribosylamine--glycine ligase|uniref:Phosphoribosylamine--glycine ligase n=1 Tax=Sumerlaea chitinivorans TaxID=2250252 RepID=A0A2Z4Y2F6_SUMC1|nr:Phosphoribosylamine--glycine ligase [Candidatus Sumerlaea chitinivorans]RMH23807.1 MAG: phosphoribosylamine--glycine ligase [Candidatus Hydrogenedentota bacterium]GIX44832.1 MAG: phosphoribosylamine--glycine ligase [Candidatus Sumerlaea sp.]
MKEKLKKVLVIGGGGREHAIVWKLRQSKRVAQIYCTPGNAGIARDAITFEASFGDNFAKLVQRALLLGIDYTIVGPEAPLAEGIVDAFEAAGLKIFGPNRQAARLEASKSFAKEVMQAARIPTAEAATFEDAREAIRFAKSLGAPLIVKADGLAAGKGVVVARTMEEAISAIRKNLEEHQFGEASKRIVIEEYLEGEEASILAFTDGNVILPMASAQDHKRLNDGDLGPNTGGMGAYSPAPIVTPELMDEVRETVFLPLMEELQRRGITYKGVIYAGLMITEEGPRVLEFNCRFGDPETQVILPRLKNDLLDLVEAVCEGTLCEHTLEWTDEVALCVVMAARGYPEAPEKGAVITGLDEVMLDGQALVFHAGTAQRGRDIVVSGGRVLGVTVLASSLPRAMDAVYRQVERIHFDGAHFRRDIGRKALAHL